MWLRQADCEWCGKIVELMAAVDAYIPTPERATDKPFLMPVEDVFTITGRGTVATGRVERGTVKVGETVEIVGMTEEPQIHSSNRRRNVPQTAGPSSSRRQHRLLCCVVLNVKILNVAKYLQNQAAFIRTPNSKREVYVLTKEEGGRHTPFFNGYRPQFYFRTTDVTGVADVARRCRNGNAWR